VIRTGASLIAVLSVLVVAPGAQAKLTDHSIVLGTSIGGLSIGTTRAQVEHRLGRGRLLGHGRGRIENWPKLGLAFTFKGASPFAKAVAGVTRNPAYATPEGIRFGSATADVTNAYPSLQCTDSGDSSPGHPYKKCRRAGPQGRETEFDFDQSGDVILIAVGIPAP
jgi:hypothetical protein